MPVSASATSSICRGPGSDVKTTDASWATSFGVSAQVAPSSIRFATASLRTSVTTSSTPAAMRLRAIGLPMFPVPMKPALVIEAPLPVHRNYDAPVAYREECIVHRSSCTGPVRAEARARAVYKLRGAHGCHDFLFGTPAREHAEEEQVVAQFDDAADDQEPAEGGEAEQVACKGRGAGRGETAGNVGDAGSGGALFGR